MRSMSGATRRGSARRGCMMRAPFEWMGVEPLDDARPGTAAGDDAGGGGGVETGLLWNSLRECNKIHATVNRDLHDARRVPTNGPARGGRTLAGRRKLARIRGAHD